MTIPARVGMLLACVALALLALVPASAQTDATPKRGGTLVVGLNGGDPESLDPTVSRGNGIAVYPAICQRLYKSVRIRGQIEMVPVLAASLPVLSEDKLSYTIHLRKGVRFNDGTPFNARAVVTTIKRFMTHPNSSRATDYDSVARVSAPGPYTVVYHLKWPDSAVPALGNPYVLSPAALAKYGNDFAAHPVCAGPFMFEERVPGDHITVKRSPWYYDKKAVHLDRIVYRPTPNAAAAAAALKAGDIHVLDQVSATEFEAIRRDSRVRVLTSPQLGWRGLIINIGNENGLGKPYTNVGSPLASSPMLRQALEEAIDRTTLNRVVFSGYYQPSCSPIAPANTTWNPSVKVPCTPYDPADAKRLVAQSGVANPTVRLLVSDTTDNVRFAQFIAEQAKAVGIDVVIDALAAATVTARQNSGDFDVTLGGLIPGSVEPSGLTHQFFATWGVRNISGYSNPRLDYVFRNATKASSFEGRATNYHVMQEILSAERPAIFLYNPTTLFAVRENVGGVTLGSNGFPFWEEAWFK